MKQGQVLVAGWKGAGGWNGVGGTRGGWHGVGGTGWVERGGWVGSRWCTARGTHRSMRVRRGCVYFTIKNYRTRLCALALSCVRNVHAAWLIVMLMRDGLGGRALASLATLSRSGSRVAARPPGHSLARVSRDPLSHSAGPPRARGRKAREGAGRHGSYHIWVKRRPVLFC